MATTTADRLTVADLDEALRHLSLIPENERGAAWRSYSDAILEKRTALEAQHG